MALTNMRSFGMNLFFFDPYLGTTRHPLKKVNSLKDLLKLADILSIHVPLSDETIGLIGAKEISLMSKKSYIINTSRGKIIDEEALINALKENRIAGAAVDVLANELLMKLDDNNMVNYARENSNLLITPHIGGATIEAIESTDEFILNKFKNDFQ